MQQKKRGHLAGRIAKLFIGKPAQVSHDIDSTPTIGQIVDNPVELPRIA